MRKIKLDDEDNLTGLESTVLYPETNVIIRMKNLLLRTSKILEVVGSEALQCTTQLPSFVNCACANYAGCLTGTTCRRKIWSVLLLPFGSYRTS